MYKQEEGEKATIKQIPIDLLTGSAKAVNT